MGDSQDHQESHASRLHHGDACLPCRHKKARCDAKKPTCSRCSRLNTTCLYAGAMAPRPRLVDALESRVLQLEHQIVELKQVHEDSILPDRVFQKIQSFVLGHRESELGTRSLPSFIPFFPWPGAPRQLLAGRRQGRVSSEAFEGGYQPVIGRSVLDELFQGWNPERDGVSVIQSLYLIRLFLPLRIYHCWYGSVPDLLSRHQLAPEDPAATHPALLNAIYLCACSAAGGVLQSHCQYFLRRTRETLQSSLALADRITHFLWASIVLSTWLGINGLCTESYVTLCSTIRFALGCGLVQSASQESILPPPNKVEEAVDRIHLAQAIYQLDRIATTLSTGVSSLLSEDELRGDGEGVVANFRQALIDPPRAWPHLSFSEEIVKLLGNVLLEGTSLRLMSERVEVLVTAVFDPIKISMPLSDRIQPHLQAEFRNLQDDLASFESRMFPLNDPIGLDPNEETSVFNPALMMNHMQYHGTVVLVNNMVAMLGEEVVDFLGVTHDSGKAKMLEATDAIVDIVKLVQQNELVSPFQVDLILFFHVSNALRVYVRELSFPDVRHRSQNPSHYDSVILLIDFLEVMLALHPSWSEIVQPLYGILPLSASALKPQSTSDFHKLSPSLRAWPESPPQSPRASSPPTLDST